MNDCLAPRHPRHLGKMGRLRMGCGLMVGRRERSPHLRKHREAQMRKPVQFGGGDPEKTGLSAAEGSLVRSEPAEPGFPMAGKAAQRNLDSWPAQQPCDVVTAGQEDTDI